MEWYKGDKELSRSEYNITNADGVVTMEIGSCQPEDSGKYRCVATNSLGEAETNCVIIVEGENGTSASEEHGDWRCPIVLRADALGGRL